MSELSGADRSMMLQMNSKVVSEEELTRLRRIEQAARDAVANASYVDGKHVLPDFAIEALHSALESE